MRAGLGRDDEDDGDDDEEERSRAGGNAEGEAEMERAREIRTSTVDVGIDERISVAAPKKDLSTCRGCGRVGVGRDPKLDNLDGGKAGCHGNPRPSIQSPTCPIGTGIRA